MDVHKISKLYYSKEKCIAYLEEVRWSGKPICPYCGSKNTVTIKRELRHHCNSCKLSFSVLVGTIFEDCRLPLEKFFMLIALMLNARKGISAMQLSRDVGITVRSSWYAAMRVRCAMVESIRDMKGTIEADEAYIGGKPRHRNKPISDSTAYLANVDIQKPKRGRGTSKLKIEGFVERDGRVVTKLLNNLTTQTLLAMLKKHVKLGRSTIMTDEFRSYNKFDEYVTHYTVNHKKKEYVRGNVHTNTVEGYWSLIKNGIKGQYHVLSKKYLPFYLAEWSYKYNRRNLQSLQFEAFIKDAVSEHKCLLYHKPVKDVSKIVYPRKDKPKKADLRQFKKANELAAKKRKGKKIRKKNLHTK